jgi:uncharacterized phage infection (PIP) family protein YhgE
MLLALVWMWFTVSVYAARTNWKVQADTYKKAYDDARKARETEHAAYLAEKDSLEKQVLTGQTRIQGLSDQIAKLQADAKKLDDALAAAQKTIKDYDVGAVELAARVQAMTDEVSKLRTRSNQLEDERVVLVIKKEQADKDKQAAEILARQATAERLVLATQIETLSAQVAEAQRTGGSGTVLNSFTKVPPALPEGIRGSVTAYRDGYVQLNLGIDAGVSEGSVLDVYRTEGDGAYLGTVTVQKVYPKDAVGVFKSKDNRPIARLRPEELPKFGDLVGKVGSTGSISQRP